MKSTAGLAEGARNLVANCAELVAGETVLIVHEDPGLGWYDAGVVSAVTSEVRRLGIEPEMYPVGAPDAETAAGVFEAMRQYDCTLFFSRIGDQNRFDRLPPGNRAVMCYARDAGTLASAYGRATHGAFLDLKDAINGILLSASRIEISCPLGTRIAGRPPANARPGSGEVSTRRFPVGVPRPMEAAGFSGRVAVARYLTPTGSRYYQPGSLELDDPMFADVEKGRIAGFEGPVDQVERVQEHYRLVAEQFDIDADAVDSWHAGIHPACTYEYSARSNPDRWSNSVFTNPRFLHFHTCGEYPPGEICWMVLDPTITVDGVKLWDGGRLRPEDFDRGRNCLDRWPELIELFDHPSDRIGLAEA